MTIAMIAQALESCRSMSKHLQVEAAYIHTAKCQLQSSLGSCAMNWHSEAAIVRTGINTMLGCRSSSDDDQRAR